MRAPVIGCKAHTGSQRVSRSLNAQLMDLLALERCQVGKLAGPPGSESSFLKRPERAQLETTLLSENGLIDVKRENWEKQ